MRGGTYEQQQHQQPSVLYAVGARACSVAMQSIHETKDNFLLVCIGFLEALDRLQERLHLPTSLVKELKRKLTQMVDRSLVRPVSAPTFEKLQQASSLGELITENDTWGEVAKPEEIKGFVHWLLAVMKSLNDLAMAGTIGVCRRIFILIMNVPGVPTACTLFCRIFGMVEHALHLTSVESQSTSAILSKRHSKTPPGSEREAYMGDPSLTAVVLEYREKECMVPMNINRRIQRVMHYQIPLRSFEATVRLPMDCETAYPMATAHDTQRADETSSSPSCPSSSSPRSIPVSPLARKKYQLAFANFSDDVLFQARDRLRLERAATISNGREMKIPRFNIQDCNEEIYLSCGRHCAVKEGTGMYRSVRTTVPIQKNRYVYFEMALSEGVSQTISSDARSNKPDLISTELSACIGLSTRSMPLNTLVGTARYSVGLYSGGHVLVGGQRRSFFSVNVGYGVPSNVGVLVYIEDVSAMELDDDDVERPVPSGAAHAEVRFSVNGVAVRDSHDQVLVVSFPLPERCEIFPTLSLHTQNARVYGNFSAPDIVAFNAAGFDLPDSMVEISCLDGLKLMANSIQSAL